MNALHTLTHTAPCTLALSHSPKLSHYLIFKITHTLADTHTTPTHAPTPVHSHSNTHSHTLSYKLQHTVT